jgi:hypothetical protein
MNQTKESAILSTHFMGGVQSSGGVPADPHGHLHRNGATAAGCLANHAGQWHAIDELHDEERPFFIGTYVENSHGIRVMDQAGAEKAEPALA